jgi:hypothetical protein
VFRCKEAGFANKLIGFEKILLGVKEYGNHSNPYDWRAENVKSTFHFFYSSKYMILCFILSREYTTKIYDRF